MRRVPPAKKNDHAKDAHDAVRGMRPRLRPWINALALNVILALGLIGFPWWRGRTRAEMSAQAYVAYAACLHAAHVSDAPGLALPVDNRERFAALYVHAVPEWPASCRDVLDRIPQEDALLLLPGAKTGEEEVRAAVTGARAALDDLIEARQAERAPQIPHRLLRTLDHLAAAVSVNIQETGLPLPTEHLAFDLGEGPSLVTPSRVPLQTASGGPLRVVARPGGLRAVVADGRSIAIVAVHDGSVDITQVRRPGSARAVIDDGATTYLGWVTNEGTCAHDEAHCARRLTGLARVRDGVQSPSPELWLAAHPALPLARSFTLDGHTLSVIAREADDTISLRRFTLPEPWPDTTPTPVLGAEEPPANPQVAIEIVALGAAHDAIVIDGAAMATLANETLIACGAGVVAIDASGAAVFRARVAAAAPTPADRGLGATVAMPVHAVDPLEDHARCASSDSGTSFAWLDRDGVLHLVADVAAPSDQNIADHIAGFAMTRIGETVIFATWGAEGQRQVTLRRVWHGRTLASDVAAACWDDGSGLCGPAGIASDDGETILYAREENDLQVLRITGASVAPLPGLE